MATFVHGRLQALERLLLLSTKLISRGEDGQSDQETLTLEFLETAAETYKFLAPSTENEMRAFRLELLSASRGIRLASGDTPSGMTRRQFLRATCLRMALQAASRVRADLTTTEAVLAQARRDLLPAVLFAWEERIVDPSSANDDLDASIRKLLDHPQTRVRLGQVLTTVSQADLKLLLAELSASIRCPAV